MDALSTTSNLTNSAVSTRDILLACITHRLGKYADEMLDSTTDVMRKFLMENKALKEIEQSVINYVKILCPPGATYKRCGVERYTESEKFIQYLKQHPTYRLSQFHNNNVTWYQISELIQFTVDLVEECCEAGKIELVKFLVDWCVSFINQQSCIYTSDGWIDLLTTSPQVWTLQRTTVPAYSSRFPAEESRRVTEEDPISISSSGISSERTSPVLSDRDSCDVDVQVTRAEPKFYQEDKSDDEAKVKHLKNNSIKKTRVGKKKLIKKTGASTTHAAPAVTYRDKKLLLLRCSCGKENKVRNGNFMGLCDNTECGKATCLLCCSTIIKRNCCHHMAWHRVNHDSVVTKEHVNMNKSLFKFTCFNCGKKSCIKNSTHRRYMGICKLCDTYSCTHPGCGKLGKYRVIKYHLDMKHPVMASASKEHASVGDENYDKSKELLLLRCGCKNIDSVKRHGKFLCKCGIPSCEYYQHFICLICGRKNIGRKGLSDHLGIHETDCDGEVNEKHVEANLKLYNKVCGKCGQKSSASFNMASRQTTAMCRCCNAFLCMFPGCERYYMVSKSARHHYNHKHRLNSVE